MLKSLFALFCVASLISYVYPLSCHNCEGNKDEVCGITVNCGQSANPNQHAACLKRIWKDSGVTHIKRSCTFVTAPKFDKGSECRPDDVECVACREDKCNSASSLGKLSIYTILAIVVPLFFVH